MSLVKVLKVCHYRASDSIVGNAFLFSNLSPTKIPYFITLTDGSEV